MGSRRCRHLRTKDYPRGESKVSSPSLSYRVKLVLDAGSKGDTKGVCHRHLHKQNKHGTWNEHTRGINERRNAETRIIADIKTLDNRKLPLKY